MTDLKAFKKSFQSLKDNFILFRDNLQVKKQLNQESLTSEILEKLFRQNNPSEDELKEYFKYKKLQQNDIIVTLLSCMTTLNEVRK